MKTPVVVTLLLLGTLLILAPIGADYLHQRNVVSLLMKAQTTTVTLTGQIGDVYRIVCWLTGSLMILVGVIGAIADARSSYYTPYVDDATEIEDDEEEDDSK